MTETEPMLAPDGEPVVLIEYQKHRAGWKPHSVVAGGSYYDFDWCAADGVLAYHNSGGGGSTGEVYELGAYCDAPKLCAKLWYDRDRVKLTHEGRPIADKEARALGYQVIREPLDRNPFDDLDADEDGTTWCVQCRARHPDGRMCNHVVWNDGGNGYCLGCGAEDVDFSAAQVSLYRLLRMLPAAGVEKVLRACLNAHCCVNEPQDLLDQFDRELDYEARYWPGIAWLSSLDHKCKEALALTAGWVWAFERKQWQAQCYVPGHQFIRHLPMPELAEWLALDPLDPRQLHDRPLRVSLNFKARSLNDKLFLENPAKCVEMMLWPPEGTDGRVICENSLTLSVAKVARNPPAAVEIYFGAVIERNGVHVSEMDGYRLEL